MAAPPKRTFAPVARYLHIDDPSDGSIYAPNGWFLTFASYSLLAGTESGWAYLFEAGNPVPILGPLPSFAVGGQLINLITLPNESGKTYYVEVAIYDGDDLKVSDVIRVVTTSEEIARWAYSQKKA